MDIDSLIKKATNILSQLMTLKVSSDVLTTPIMRKIQVNTSSDALASYSSDIELLFEILKEYFSQKEHHFPDNSINIVYGILKFLEDPSRWYDISNENTINVEDPTNEKLKEEVVHLGLAYINPHMKEFEAQKQHATSNENKHGSILY